jgi:Ni,Fe-hydrogenase III large subunit
MGPYHPALPQPLGLTFRLRGEMIAGVEPPTTGYCRRGVEALVAGKEVERALPIVERSCSFAGHSHRLAFCRAVESVTGAAPSARARLVCGLYAELERTLARLWLLGMTARAAGLQREFRRALEQRELLFDALEAATGERVYWAVPVPGGVRALADEEASDALGAALARLAPDVAGWQAAAAPRGRLGHAGAAVGRITRERAEALGLAGLAGRAAGVDRDLRRDKPYGAYADVAVEWDDEMSLAAAARGDAAARVSHAAADLATSLRLARAFLDALAGADDTALAPQAAARAADGAGHGTIEGPHGPVTATVTLGPGDVVERLRIETPAAATLKAVPEALEGLAVTLAPLGLVSLDLCVECVDL